MAGKAPKQISILASDEVADLPEFRELAAKGHIIVTFSEHDAARGDAVGMPAVPPELDEYDLIVSKQCSMYQEGMQKYLVDMVKGARSRKYGPTQLSLEV